MRGAIAAILFFMMPASASFAAAEGHRDERFYASLKRLDPVTRLDQICDYEAMLRIDGDANPFHPDRAKAEVLSTPRRTKNSVIANGGAFRSNGSWYALSFTCRTTPDNMQVVHFDYAVGKRIPESEWSKYGLWR